MRYIYVIFFSIVLMALIAFAFENHQMVTLKFILLESAPMPLFSVIYLGAFLVVVIMSFVGISEKFRLRGEIRRLKKESKTLKAELAKYKEAEAALNEAKISKGAPSSIGKKEKPKAKKKRFSFLRKGKKAEPKK